MTKLKFLMTKLALRFIDSSGAGIDKRINNKTDSTFPFIFCIKLRQCWETRFIITILFTILWGSAAANHSTTHLHQVEQKIQHLKQHIYFDQNKLRKQHAKLRNIEIEVGILGKKLSNTEQKLSQKKRELTGAENRYHQLQQQRLQQEQQLASKIKAAYILNQQNKLSIILGPQHLDEINRFLHYYQYLVTSQVQALKDLKYTMSQINETIVLMRKAKLALQKIDEELKEQQRTQKKNQKTRTAIIQQLKDALKTRKQRLTELESERQQLKETIAKLEKTRFLPSGEISFTKLKGKLHWPVNGKIVQSYGDAMGYGRLHFDGILLAASETTHVYATASGKVVFANWLSGYGLLLIVQHDHGYMTLYGRNHSLYKKVGDIVRAGDLLATVGKSGGYENAGLYFAIRHNGKAVNPTHWLAHIS